MDEVINELRALRQTKESVKSKERSLCKPLLEMGKARWLRELIPDRDTYLLIAIRMFSPRVFMGYRMKKLVRREIAASLNTNKEYVSTLVKTAIFRYNSMKKFHAEVNRQYENILQLINNSKN